ncbi:hypothetical protein ACHHV8_04080 [Paenibacillus sp. TAB 01]|uniref:hypothetical protein n=1 Tax=Paenibacillus sp. TAB 01 TaxID=3368988 RepID=UPI003750A70F
MTNYLRAQGTRSRAWKRLYLLVLRGLVYLRTAVISDIINVDITLPDEGDGAGPYEITLVKDLTGFHPLLEFRINVPGAGAARIVFIEHLHEGENYLVMMRAVVKQSKNDPGFLAIRDEAQRLLPDFLNAPHHYINTPE